MSDLNLAMVPSPEDENEASDFIEINDYIEDPNDVSEELLMEEPFNPTQINIVSRPESLHNIIERLKHNEIDMQAEFQRHEGLWTTRQMSRLIESILIRFPLPAFYFDASNEEKWQVVDGLQRLSSIKRFVVDDPNRSRLRLRGLEYLQEFNGKQFEELPRNYQRRIDECTITLFLIQKGTPDMVKYSIFRRINTGGLVLNDQEIRNARSSPELRRYLLALASDTHFIKTLGDLSKRMLDQELVLRFLAFYATDYEKERKNITTFLDEMIEILEKANRDQREIWEKKFRLAVKRCWDLFEDSAFEKRTEKEKSQHKRKNSTLFEVWTVALAGLTDEQMQKLILKRATIQENHILLMSDDNDYFRSITFATQKREHFRIRREKVQQLIQEALNA